MTSQIPVANLPTRFGKFKIYAFSDDVLVIEKGGVKNKENILVRIHSQCFTGDVLTSLRCDCRSQLELAMNLINQKEEGLIVYVRSHEGRGIGLLNKIKTYSLQEQGLDTVEANEKLGFKPDQRDYKIVKTILDYFGIKSIQLLTNNPKKIKTLESLGIKVTKRISVKIEPNGVDDNYLKTKKEKMGHLI